MGAEVLILGSLRVDRFAGRTAEIECQKKHECGAVISI
jgi:hypothetical protein